MFFLVYAVFPKPIHPDYGRIDGAYVSLFVNQPAQSSAETAARDLIETELWDIDELDEAYPVEAAKYPPGHPGRERFQQALVDGIVATFHRWPVGAPDEE